MGGRRRAGLGRGLAAAVLGAGLVLGGAAGGGPAHADALCDQMRAQYGPDWPCINVPTYTPPPTQNQPQPGAPAEPGAPGSGPGIGGSPGTGPGEGNGTPIVPVPGQQNPGTVPTAPTGPAPDPAPAPGTPTDPDPTRGDDGPAPVDERQPRPDPTQPPTEQTPVDHGSAGIPTWVWLAAAASALGVSYRRTNHIGVSRGIGVRNYAAAVAPGTPPSGGAGGSEGGAIGSDDGWEKAPPELFNPPQQPPAELAPVEPPPQQSPSPVPGGPPAEDGGSNSGSTEDGLPGDSPGDGPSENGPFSDLFYVHDDGTIEVRPALFGFDDAVLASILATMLAAAMLAIIAEYGWAWVLQNRDKVPDLMIDRLPGWIGASVVQVTVWVSKFFADSGADEDLRYEPTDKHSKSTPHHGRKGTEMDLTKEQAQKALEESVKVGDKRYGYRDGKVYEFQKDNRGSYHGYPRPGNTIDGSTLKKMRDNGLIDDKTMKRLMRQK